MGVGTAYWRIVLSDIASGGATATITLKSGVQHRGEPEPAISGTTAARLRTSSGGWIVIDLEEVASIEGWPR